MICQEIFVVFFVDLVDDTINNYCSILDVFSLVSLLWPLCSFNPSLNDCWDTELEILVLAAPKTEDILWK